MYELEDTCYSYIIVQALCSERLQGYKLRLSLSDRPSPSLPLWQGLWPSAGHSLGLALPSLRQQSHERRAARDMERVTVGEGNTWPGANLLCTLSHYFTHPSPNRTMRSSLYSNSSTNFHTHTRAHHVSLLSLKCCNQRKKDWGQWGQLLQKKTTTGLPTQAVLKNWLRGASANLDVSNWLKYYILKRTISNNRNWNLWEHIMKHVMLSGSRETLHSRHRVTGHKKCMPGKL